MSNKIMEVFAKMLFQITEPERPEAERPTDEEPLSVCCSAPFTYPGWPDSDFCSECHEHASTWEDEDG